MDGARRVRVRGVRVGRGVRVLLPVMGEELGEGRGGSLGDGRGRTSGRGRGGAGVRRRGGAGVRSRGGGRESHDERPGPTNIEDLHITNIQEMPVDQPLERPLHPWRRRRWQPFVESEPSATPPSNSPTPMVISRPSQYNRAPSPLASTSFDASPEFSVPSPVMFVECEASATPPSISPAPMVISRPSQYNRAPSPLASTSFDASPATSVPSPVMFVECEASATPPSISPAPMVISRPSQFIDSSSAASPPSSPGPFVSPRPSHSMQAPRSRPRQILRDENISAALMGSDESGEDSDEEELVCPFVSRVFRGTMDTSMDFDSDHDEEFAEGFTAGDPAPIASSSAPEVSYRETSQPWTIYDFNWTAFPNPPIPPGSRRETFSQSNVGPTTPCVDPYDIFIAIWDRQIMEHIASETNRYARQVTSSMLQQNFPSQSRMHRWHDTTVDELYVYFAIVLAMGVVVKSRLSEYWTATPDIFYTPGFSAHMSINRFILLNKCIHFNNNEDMCALNLTEVSEAKLFKIQPILSHLNMKFEEMYILQQNIALDESLLQWKGWLDISQLIPNKAATVGIKSYEICESQTGYLWRFEIHAHKKSPPQRSEDPLSASTPAIVLRLIQGLENKGYTLWMDNFYNSPILARRLKTLGFDCVGTLRTNRKFVPQALHKLTKQNMRKGEVSGLSSGDVDIIVFRDNNRVATISTYHGAGVAEYRGSTKPIVILDYNIMMGGVDKKDQMLSMYPVERKRTKVWYKKLFRRLLNVSVLNSYIIHKKSSSSSSSVLSHRSFRITLIKSLLSKHAPDRVAPQAPASRRTLGGLGSGAGTTRADLTHRLSRHTNADNKRIRRVCKICKSGWRRIV